MTTAKELIIRCVKVLATLGIISVFIQQMADANSEFSKKQLTEGATVRIFDYSNPSPLFNANSGIAEMLTPNFDDSLWYKISSLKSFEEPSNISKIPCKMLLDTANCDNSQLNFFPALTPTEDAHRKLVIVRTSFTTDGLSTNTPLYLSFYGVRNIAVFVNGKLTGSNFQVSPTPSAKESETELGKNFTYQIFPETLKLGTNTLVIAAPVSAWILNPVDKMFLTDNPSETSTMAIKESIRTFIPTSLTPLSLIAFVLFLILATKNRQQKRFATLAGMALFAALASLFVSGIWETIPLHIVYQRKILAASSVFFSALSFRMTIACFEMEDRKLCSKTAENWVFYSLVFLGVILFGLTNGSQTVWEFVVTIQLLAMTIPSVLAISACTQKEKTGGSALKWLVFAHIVVLVTIAETYLNFKFDYWESWTAIWSFAPITIVAATLYIHKFFFKWQELSRLQLSVEETVLKRTEELEQVTRRLRREIVKCCG